MEQNVTEQKKRIFSGVQPSGNITLGNYLGAIKNWVSLQDDYECIFAMMDLHTITVRQTPAEFRASGVVYCLRNRPQKMHIVYTVA